MNESSINQSGVNQSRMNQSRSNQSRSSKLHVQIGDRVIIVTPPSPETRTPQVSCNSFVTAVRPKSFDAGGFCFHLNGKEWNGRHYVCTLNEDQLDTDLHPLQTQKQNTPPSPAFESTRLQYAGPEREIFVLAFVLANRPEEEWLTLGLANLRKIAAMLGIRSAKSPS